ncbi:MAG: TldD/PmbA family protein [Acidobacteria bacterium]|nr:TldD/PmbA family protein [Acidobacteriota bacterium]MBI3471095.1 TldD/PmbA family protein [Candidatus Solibacter usitatus]
MIDLAADLVQQALAAGATGAECILSEGEEFSANVRMRELESLKEAGSRGAGLRVVKGKRSGSAYTSDFSVEGIRRLVASAVEMAGMTTEDPHAGLPDPDELGALDGDLKLFRGDVADLDTPRKIELTRETEIAALDFDPRIANSEGASFDTHLGHHVFANSHGFAGEYRTSYCSLSAVPIAKEGDSMERDYWYSMARGLEGLEPPAEIGRIAARRALRRLGARKVDTQKAPVVFEPRAARDLLGDLFEAVHGEAIYRQASFLAGKLGQRVASEKLTIIDDGTIPSLFGTSPFDDEGVPTRRTVVIENGVLRSYLLNTYTARKLGMKTTGNASRGITGNAGIGHNNFYIAQGDKSPEEILRPIRNGFYVTEMMGFGVNTVTGDFSVGANGLWIRDGELAFPVSEVTIAGNLNQMLMNVEAVGTDLEFRGSTAAPTLCMGEMTIGGK